jgi:hypothetical protein
VEWSYLNRVSFACPKITKEELGCDKYDSELYIVAPEQEDGENEETEQALRSLAKRIHAMMESAAQHIHHLISRH